MIHLSCRQERTLTDKEKSVFSEHLRQEALSGNIVNRNFLQGGKRIVNRNFLQGGKRIARYKIVWQKANHTRCRGGCATAWVRGILM